TGARGLMTILEQVFRGFKFELPSTGIKTFVVDADTVSRPERTLQALLKANAEQQREVLRSEVTAFAQRFQQQHGFQLDFDDSAVTALIDLSLQTEKTIRAICEERFHNFEHGLKLLAQGETPAFPITADVVADPERAVSRWVVERFRGTPTAAPSA
ncbi:MAG TPA: ATP-dependent protease, partial [Candidatus Synoicihabitans sp.]|nr:ATP-dependent protease [Candidatus Synoicihabitans sp.]